MQVSYDLSIIDLDVPFSLIFSITATSNTCATLVVLAVVTWQVLLVSIPMVYLTLSLQVINTIQDPFMNIILWKQFSFICHINEQCFRQSVTITLGYMMLI